MKMRRMDRTEEERAAKKKRTESSSSRSCWSRHLIRLSSCSKLLDTATSRCHVGKLVGSFLGEVVESTSNHDLCLSAENCVDCDLDRLKGSGARSDRDLDRSTGGEKEKINPSGDGIDEAKRDRAEKEDGE